MPTAKTSAPLVNTMSAASGSPKIWSNPGAPRTFNTSNFKVTKITAQLELFDLKNKKLHL